MHCFLITPKQLTTFVISQSLCYTADADGEPPLANKMDADGAATSSDTLTPLPVRRLEPVEPGSESDSKAEPDSGVSSTEADEVFYRPDSETHVVRRKVRRRLQSQWLKKSPNWLQRMEERNTLAKTPLSRRTAGRMHPLISRWPLYLLLWSCALFSHLYI